MSKTSIEWTDFSINPIRARLGENVGHYCEKISTGCRNCYSSRFQPRFGLPQFQEQRALDDIEPFLEPGALEEVLRRRKPTKWFWCDMTDMFGDWVPFEWVAACFGVMAATPRHTHQVLTKRPNRALEFFEWSSRLGKPWLTCRVEMLKVVEPPRDDFGPQTLTPWPLPNVWLGVSVENQETADERIPLLLKCPAAVRWISAEPLLGPLDVRPYLHRGKHQVCPKCMFATNAPAETCPNDGAALGPDIALDWVVVGGESGPGARFFNIDWARTIVAQCRASGVATFVKQFGSLPYEGFIGSNGPMRLKNRKGGDVSEWPEDLRVREFPEVRP